MSVTASKWDVDDAFNTRNSSGVVTDNKTEASDAFGTRNSKRPCLATPPCTCRRGKHLMPEGEPVWFAFIGYSGLTQLQRYHGMVCREHMKPLELERNCWLKAPCEVCGRLVHWRPTGRDYYRRHTFCSERCKSEHYSAIQKQHRLQRRNKVCLVCEQPFIAKRADAKTCSRACRQRAYRGRSKAA